MKPKQRTSPKSASEEDVQIGNRIRLRRRALNISQETLAGYVGTSPQQVQKYENGKNRISATRLYRIADLLECSMLDFFDIEQRSKFEDLSATEQAFLRMKSTDEFMEGFLRLGPEQRTAVIALVKSTLPEEE